MTEQEAATPCSIKIVIPACAGSYSGPKPGECRGYPEFTDYTEFPHIAARGRLFVALRLHGMKKAWNL